MFIQLIQLKPTLPSRDSTVDACMYHLNAFQLDLQQNLYHFKIGKNILTELETVQSLVEKSRER